MSYEQTNGHFLQLDTLVPILNISNIVVENFTQIVDTLRTLVSIEIVHLFDPDRVSMEIKKKWKNERKKRKKLACK